jgi:multiple sugar transport system ATP-binding protein
MAEVRFENVTKQFGDTVAVLRLLSGLEILTDGKNYIGEQLVNNVPSKDRNIAMVFQSYALYPHMSVYNNMAFGLSLRKVPKADIARRVQEAAHILGIEDLLKRKPRQLSGGQRQRVALGRAIVREPAAFLLDEPLSNLDAKLRVQTRAELSKLHQRLGTTFVYVTHDQIEAMTMASRIAVLDKGVLQQVGTPKELYDRPGNIFVAGFIGSPAMNFFEVTVGGNKDEMSLDAESFHAPAPSQKTAMLAPSLGKKIVLGIRPEDIHIKEYLPTGISSSAVVPAKVDVIELMGNELFIYMISGKHQFLARVDPRARARPGDDLELVFNMDNLHAFNLETGKAILA